MWESLDPHRFEDASFLSKTGGTIVSDTQQAGLTAISLFRKKENGTFRKKNREVITPSVRRALRTAIHQAD